MKEIQIAIADDQMLFRKGMIALLESFEHIKVTIESEDGESLLQILLENEKKPDVVLLDLQMPGIGGIETALQIIKHHKTIKVIILSVHENENIIAHLIDSGVHGYLVKNCEPEEVETAIRTVLSNDCYYNKRTIEALKNSLFSRRRKTELLKNADLTNREKEILVLICEEYTTPEIAGKLYLSTRTVDGHRNNLLEKTGAKNTVGLVLFAARNNYIQPYEPGQQMAGLR